MTIATRGDLPRAGVVIAVVLACASAVRAKGPDFTVDPLGRISSLYVMVLDLQSDIEADGLSVDTLRSTVEPMLQEIGIQTVNTRDYAFALHRRDDLPPALVIDVHSLPLSESAYVVNLELEVWERAILAQSPSVGVDNATTWRAPAMLLTIRRDRVSDVYAHVKRLVGEFLKQFRQAKLAR